MSSKKKKRTILPFGADLERVATVRALRKSGITYRKIEELLGMSHTTIAKYEKIEDEQVDQLSNLIKKHWMVSDYKNAEKAYNELSIRLDDAGNISFRDLVGAYKIFRELPMNAEKNGHGGGNAIQVNVITKEGIVQLSDTVIGEE